LSFERYRGASASLLKAKVAAVEIVDPPCGRFRLKQPWPDFLTFYWSTTLVHFPSETSFAVGWRRTPPISDDGGANLLF